MQPKLIQRQLRKHITTQQKNLIRKQKDHYQDEDNEFAKWLLSTSEKDRNKLQTLLKNEINQEKEKTQTKKENNKLRVRPGIDLLAGFEAFKLHMTHEIKPPQIHEKIQEDVLQIIQDIQRLEDNHIYQELTNEHNEWSHLASQISKNKLIDQYQLPLEKEIITPRDWSAQIIYQLEDGTRGAKDDIQLYLKNAENQTYDPASTDEVAAQKYSMVQETLLTNPEIIHIFRAIQQQDTYKKALENTDLPKNLRQTFNEKVEIINDALKNQLYTNLIPTTSDKEKLIKTFKELPKNKLEKTIETINNYYNGVSPQIQSTEELIIQERLFSNLGSIPKEEALQLLEETEQQYSNTNFYTKEALDVSVWQKDPLDVKAPTAAEKAEIQEEMNQFFQENPENFFEEALPQYVKLDEDQFEAMFGSLEEYDAYLEHIEEQEKEREQLQQDLAETEELTL